MPPKIDATQKISAPTVIVSQAKLFGLNVKEWEYIARHPINSPRGAFCIVGAENRTLHIGGNRVDTRKDALRHTYWAACMAKMLGPVAAQEILDNHGYGNANAMDAANNKYGVDLGTRNAGPLL